MTPSNAALNWIERGYLPIPIPFRSKKPVLEGWPALRISKADVPRYFNGQPQNIGVKLGEPYGAADIDLDCGEAIAAAATLAPATGLIFGRASSPGSHRFYRSDPPMPSRKYLDPTDKACLCELRCLKADGSIGLQTVVPGSVHEQGEEIRFESGFDREPANIDGDELAHAVARIAAAALLARHWPAAGHGRHECELALAGCLARAGWSLEDAEQFVLATYRAVPSHDRTKLDRVRQSVLSSFGKKNSDYPVTGFTALSAAVGDAVAKAATKWLGITADPSRVTAEQPAAGGAAGAALPEIRISGRELRDLSAETLQALTAANEPEPKLFSRSGVVVRVDLTEAGQPVVTNVTDVHLRGEMTLAANFYKVFKAKDSFVNTPVLPPLDVAKNLLSRPAQELNLPALVSIAESPFMAPDGHIVSTPGYDSETRTFYAQSGDIAGFDVPDRPTVDDVDGARALIEEVFVDFPFVDAASRANALALFISPELRPAIRGSVPAALVDAPQLGTGKTLIADVVALKTTGRLALMKPAPKSESEEWRKMLTATLQAGHSLAVFDNVESVLSSSDLALVLTAGTVTDRVLGRTEMVTLPVRTVFVITGNNLVLGGDMPRRCYWIRVDAKSSEPWMNREFHHPDLKAWVLSNRGRLLGAVLTLARAWYVAGCPAAPTPVLGSFEDWCRTVGGILHFAGIEGFLGNLEELYRDADPSQAAWEAFLSELLEQMPRGGFKVADMVVELQRGQSLRGVLPDDLGDMEPLSSFQRRLGRALTRRANRRFGARALHLVRGGMSHGGVVWSIREKAE